MRSITLVAVATLLVACTSSESSKSNEAPSASNLSIADNNNGTLVADVLLTANYSYKDKEGDEEAGTTFQWLRDGQTIAGATSKNYRITGSDRGKNLSFRLTPMAATGTAEGETVTSSSRQVNDNRVPANLSFISNAAKTLVSGDIYHNRAVSSNSRGTITYSSNNTNAATVLSNGTVSIVGPGTATISANIAETSAYLQNQVSYTITAIANDNRLTVWLGGDQSDIQLSGSGIGNTLTISNTENCDVSNYGACTNGQQITSTADRVTNSVSKLSNSSYYQLQLGNDATRIARTSVNSHRFLKLTGAQAISFKDKLWVFGGRRINDASNGIWVSENGSDWKQVNDGQDFTARQRHRVVEMNDKLFIIGGVDSSGNAMSDVWSSDDGIHWTQLATNAFFHTGYQSAVAHDGKLWVFGGSQSNNRRSIYNSTDGATWNTVTTGSVLDFLYYGVVATQGKLIAINSGGADVRESTDGINWTINTSSSGFASRGIHESMVVLNNRIYVMGGTTSANDVWSSGDRGKSWTRATNDARFPARSSQALASFNNKLWAISGQGNHFDVDNDVWSSSDGATWEPAASFGNYAGRRFDAIVELNDQLYMLGGYRSGFGLNDVWRSSDGIQWEPVETNNVFDRQLYPQAVVFNNAIWLVGTKQDRSGNTIWRSENGVDWTVANSAPAFPARERHALFSYGNKLWLIGGKTLSNPAGLMSDIWMSNDGITWVQVTANAPFSSRYDHQIAVGNGKVFLSGGYDGSNLRDFWMSTDGSNWTRRNSNVAFGGQSAHTMISLNNSNTLAVVDASTSTTWISTDDGASWGTVAGDYPPRNGATMVKFKDQILMYNGYVPSDSKYGSDVWRYNPSQGEWYKGFSLPLTFKAFNNAPVILRQP